MILQCQDCSTEPEHSRASDPLPPQAGAGESRAFHERAQLGPHHALGHQVPASRGAKTAISTGNDPTAIPYRLDRLTDAIGHDFGMLDVVGGRIDHSR